MNYRFTDKLIRVIGTINIAAGKPWDAGHITGPLEELDRHLQEQDRELVRLKQQIEELRAELYKQA